MADSMQQAIGLFGGAVTLVPGGVSVRDSARLRSDAMDRLVAQAKEFATAASASTLEAAATQKNLKVTSSDAFTRGGFVPGMGRLNEAIGAAFSLPIGVVSNPIRTQDGVVVLRVDRRVDADRAEWEKQKTIQRQQLVQGMRQQRIQAFLQQLRADAKLDDRRKDLAQAARQTT